MIEKELKQKAIKKASKLNLQNVSLSRTLIRRNYIADILVEFANEATKELQEEINEWKDKFTNLQKYLETQNCYRECAETWEKNKELQEQIENLQIMLQAEREVRCNDEYLKKVTELEAYNEKLLNSDIEKHNKIVYLEAQIEEMKLCQNCKFEDTDDLEEPCSVCTRCLGDIKRKGNSDKWELAE